MKTEALLKTVLKDITPSLREIGKVKRIQRSLASACDMEYIFCGSIAKDTWLSGHKDIDMFILFDENEDRKTLETKGIETGRGIIEKCGGSWNLAYSEHPYVKGIVDGHHIDIVPAYKVKDPSKIKSAVDRTPYHVVYVENHMSKDLSAQVRLLKKFCSGTGTYGSDLKTEGFSGYLCELLVIKYGSFMEVLRNASSWKPGTVIDIKSHYSNSSYAKQKFSHPLIVIDPVDKNRNVAAVLSAQSFFRFVKNASEFMESPDLRFFYPMKEMLSRDEIDRIIDARGTKFALIKFSYPQMHEDIIWSQAKKFSRRIVDILEESEFSVLRDSAWTDGGECVVMVEMLVDALPKIQKRLGPEIMDTVNSEGFLKRYRGNHVFIEDGRWAVEYFRPHTHYLELLKSVLSASRDNLRSIGVPGHIADSISDDVEIFTEENIHDMIENSDDFRMFISDYLKRDI